MPSRPFQLAFIKRSEFYPRTKRIRDLRSYRLQHSTSKFRFIAADVILQANPKSTRLKHDGQSVAREAPTPSELVVDQILILVMNSLPARESEWLHCRLNNGRDSLSLQKPLSIRSYECP